MISNGHDALAFLILTSELMTTHDGTINNKQSYQKSFSSLALTDKSNK